MSGIPVETRTGFALQVIRRCGDNVLAAVKRLARPVNLRPGFPYLDTPRHVAIVLAVAIVAILLGMTFVDAPATRSVSGLPAWLVEVFNFLTDFGKSAWFLWPLGLLFLFLAALPRTVGRMSRGVLAALMVHTGFLFIAIGLPGLFAALVKNMIGRARPGVGGSIDPFLFDPFHWTPAYASFPSGHGTAAFAICAAFSTLWPRTRTFFLIYAAIIAASRVVVQAHYVTDVAASALVGIVGVVLVRHWFATQRLGFSVAPNGQVHLFPGPSVRRIKSVARELLA